MPISVDSALLATGPRAIAINSDSDGAHGQRNQTVQRLRQQGLPSGSPFYFLVHAILLNGPSQGIETESSLESQSRKLPRQSALPVALSDTRRELLGQSYEAGPTPVLKGSCSKPSSPIAHAILLRPSSPDQAPPQDPPTLLRFRCQY